MKKLKICLIIILVCIPLAGVRGQVADRQAIVKENHTLTRDSMLLVIRQQDSLLRLKRRDSALMAAMIVRLEYFRDSLNAALTESIYQQKLDSAENMRKYFAQREFNRRSRYDLYNPVGQVDDDSVRSSVRDMIDVVFEDTAYYSKPVALKSMFDRLVGHLANDSVFFRFVNTRQDTTPFVLKKDRIDSTAFFVMNSNNDSVRIYMRGLDKNTLYVWVGDDLMLKEMLKKEGPPDMIGVNWQDRSKIRIKSRPVPVPKPKLWYLRSELSLIVNQATYINWARGGSNNIAFTTDVKGWANFAKGSIRWDNYAWFIYGVQKAELQELRKSADRINLVSNLSHKAFKNFDYTLGTTFDTQGFRGYAYPNDSVPVSKFMAPADLRINLGLTYKPSPKLTINMYPVGGQLRMVLDTARIDQTKYGLKPYQRVSATLGPRVIINHSTTIFKNVVMSNYLDLFSNYIENPQKINFDWRLALSLKVNKYISTGLQTELIYDDRMIIPIYKIQDGKKVKVGEGKRVQFNEILGVTFKYII